MNLRQMENLVITRYRRRNLGPLTITDNGGNEREEENQQKTGISLLDLPSYIQTGILSRLPIEAILSCRCVCKTWLDLLSDPFFIDSYLKTPPFTGIVLCIDNTLYLLELDGEYDYTCRPIEPKKFITELDPPEGHRLELVGSCNGLICLWSHRPYKFIDTLYVGNPIFGEFVEIPKPRAEKQIRYVAYGFCFCPITRLYKVFRITRKKFHAQPVISEGEVCTVGTGKWRTVGEAPFPLFGKMCCNAINGAIHWLEVDIENSEFVYSFNVGEEKVQSIPFPPRLGVRNISLGLGMLGNCLCIFDSSSSGHFELWSMRDYGVVDSWRKDLILLDAFPSGLRDCALQPITVWKDGETLIACQFGSLISYNPKERNAVEVKVNGLDRAFETASYLPAATFAPNFCLLEDIVMGGFI